MIAINKAEKELIAERFPNAHIVRTMKSKSKRHRYYCEENRQVINFLNKQRGIFDNKSVKGDGRYRNRKNEKRVSV